MESYKMASVFRALSCKKRFAIVKMLLSQELCVGTIAEKLGASQSSVSQHLRVLRDSGLVTDHRYGYHIHYTANRELLEKVTDNLLEMLSCTDHGDGCSRKGKSCVKEDTA
ncbi:MAG: winged helix-turn-helix transcriptional regulator [Candidatus Fermentibacteraceae bacterium]|nr:winged helix-turn-helix transcriptional regulator [Candidatus Fermentibacteraceae bacterium]